MDKIDEIHIGRVPFSIEAKAEIELKRYLAEIRPNLDVDTADDVVQDIEARIPELLSLRHIKSGDVITHQDVVALKQQLGEPEQFSGDQPSVASGEKTKKLFRDTDSGIIGGVASGIGKYFNIDANFVRAAFFITAFLYGSGILLYAFLWVLVPEAKTSADKLMMSGEPVTVANLQRYREAVQKSLSNGPRLIRHLLRKTIQIFSATFTAIASLLLLSTFGVFSGLFYVYPFRPIAGGYDVDYLVLGLLWLVCLSFIGLLILLTTRVWGYRSSRLSICALIFSVVFIVAIAGTITSGFFVYNHFSDKYGGDKDIRELALSDITPASAPTVLTVKSDSNLDLTYVITNQPIHATYEDYPAMNYPNITITNDKGTIMVDSTKLSQTAPNCLGGLCQKIYLPVHVFLYGPSLKSYYNVSGATLNINNTNLGSSVNFTAANWSVININNSDANTMSIAASNNASVQANNTTAQTTLVNIDQTSFVSIPITNVLTANIPLSCSEVSQNALNAPYPPSPPSPPGTNLFLPGYPLRTFINKHATTITDLNQNDCINTN